MSRLGCVLAALLLAALVPPVTGQAPTPIEQTVLEDGAADVAARLDATDVATAPGGRWSTLDLKALRVLESPDAFSFTLQVADLEPDGEAPLAEGGFYRANFRQNDAVYSVVAFRSHIDASFYFAVLERYDPAFKRYFHVTDLADATIDDATSSLSVTVPRNALLDTSGAQPYPGAQLTDFVVTSHGVSENLNIGIDRGGGAIATKGPKLRLGDRMPNSGNGTLGVDVVYGLAQTGHLRLVSEEPVRASNGEATTFVFRVDLVNLEAADDRATLSVAGAPPTWQVRLPAPVVDIPGNGSISLPVLVTTPFAHDHGAFAAFRVEAQSLNDAGSTGRLELGIRYNQIPQPAGHHNIVSLHSRKLVDDQVVEAINLAFGGTTAHAYMNAAPDDAADEDLDVPAYSWGITTNGTGPTPVRQNYRWIIDLEPGLTMGLDFDRSGTATLKLPIKTTLPMPATAVSAALVYHMPPDDDGPVDNSVFQQGKPIVVFEPTPEQDLGLNSLNLLELTGTVLPAGDYIPYRANSGLTLEVNLTTARADPFFGPRDVPALAPGGEVSLPMFEYRDPVDQVFTAIADLELRAISTQDQFVNPGEVALFELELVNGGESGDFSIEVSGLHAEWAQVLGDTEVRVGSGATAPLAIAVLAPADARDGEVADLVLQASRSDDPNVRVLARLVATTDLGADHPDAADRMGQIVDGLGSQDSPGPGAAWAALALVALAVALRRKNNP